MNAMRSLLANLLDFCEYREQEYERKCCEKVPDLERCPRSQRELRTIVFKQEEYYRNLLGGDIQRYTSNFFGVTSFEIHALQALFSPALFEPSNLKALYAVLFELELAIFKRRF